MKFVILVILSTALAQIGYDGYTEWQSGIDRTVNRQEQFTSPKFPIQVHSRILFPRRFTRRPQVLIMHEEIEWSKNRNVNYQTFISDVTVNGFYLNYIINGPAIMPILKVRWVAMVDSEAEVMYVNYKFEDLYRLRQGHGTRMQDFIVEYYLKFPLPRVTAFIVGADIEVFDSLTTTVQMVFGIPTASTVPIRILTRDRCHINALRIAYFISSDYSTLMGTVGSSDNYYNGFLDNTNRVKLRVQRFEREVPVTFVYETHKNVLAQGITGFDAHSRAGNMYLKVGGEYIDSRADVYHCAYGTRGDTMLQYMQIGYILHAPALPPKEILVELQSDEVDNEQIVNNELQW